MNNVFLTSDHHFGHKKILEFEKDSRPFETIEEHDEELIKRWNAKVGKRDTVYHLGDFCFGEKNLQIAGRLNGYKKLILGNHDLLASGKYLDYFNKVYGVVHYKGYILSHIPVHPDQKYRYRGNIHGHLHSKTIADEFYINVSVELHDLAPVSFEDLNKRLANVIDWRTQLGK